MEMQEGALSELVRAGTVADAASLELEHEPVPRDQLVAGAPTTGWAELCRFGDAEVGVWEMTAGAMTDTEADEVFVVLAGAATVEFDDGSPTMTLAPGTVGRFAVGTRTTWTVTETLRKVYITPA